MIENIIKIPANENELKLYCFVGEAIWKTQIVEQALSCSITLKTNPAATREQADEVLRQHQSYTLGQAINIASKKNCIIHFYKRSYIHSQRKEIS